MESINDFIMHLVRQGYNDVIRYHATVELRMREYYQAMLLEGDLSR